MPRSRLLASASLPVALAAAALPAAAAAAPSADAVIAEAYGGGGNAGATLTTDFIELSTRGSAPVDVTGWSVQYLPAAPGPTSQWQVTPLDGALVPGDRYLVAEARGAGGTAELPAPDATGTIALAAGSGTVALVTTTERLTCVTSADCAADARIRDLLGYGSAAVRERTPSAAASNTTSAARGTSLADTDDNAADFTIGAPTPAGAGTEPEPPTVARIRDVQGTTRLSPLDGQAVADVPGIVTAIRAFGSARGFWFQDPEPDRDARTSEGLFVFTGGTTPAVAVGDAVRVAGTVDEFYPDGAPAGAVTQSVTELTRATWTVASSGNAVPAPERVRRFSVPGRYAPAAGGGSIESRPLEPGTYGLDFWESREGMNLRVDDVRVTGPTTAFNELWVTVKPLQNAGPRGVTRYRSYDDQNAGRLKIESLIPFAQRPFPQADVRDLLRGTTAGPLDFDQFGGYTLQATALGQVRDGLLRPEVTRPKRRSELAIATYNVENLDPSDPQAKFDRLAQGIVRNLARPDVVALEEIQDDNGPVNDAVVSAGGTLQRFTDAIVAAGGPRYAFRQIDPADDQDGGEPGGNIRVAFLFDPGRVTFVDRPGGTATTPVQVVGSGSAARLSISPGRVNPLDPAWTHSRNPLAAELSFRGRTVFVVANHFNSKGGDQPLYSRFQPPARSSEEQRRAQATAVRAFVGQLLAADPRADVVVLGDINDFQFSPVTGILTSGGALRTLVNHLPPFDRYTYVFDGNAQVLDQTLVSPGVRVADYDIVHVNAEFADKASDHDPQVTRIAPGGD